MKRSEIAQLADLVHIRVQQEELDDLKANPAFQRQEQGLIDLLDALYSEIVRGGHTQLQTEFLRGQIAVAEFILRLKDGIQGEIDGNKAHGFKHTEEDTKEGEKFVAQRYYQGDENHG